MKKQTEFYIITTAGYVLVKGREISVPAWPGERFFIHRPIDIDGGWCVSHVRSGFRAAYGAKTQADAMHNLMFRIANWPDFDFDDFTRTAVKNHGPMPELAVV